MPKYRLIAIMFMPFSMMGLAAAAAEKPPAKEMACRACHGALGEKPLSPTYPKLKGQNKAYLVASLKAYRSGSRSGGMAVMMAMQAKSLSDADIELLAEYYSKQ